MHADNGDGDALNAYLTGNGLTDSQGSQAHRKMPILTDKKDDQ